MVPQQVDAAISADDLKAVTDALETIREKLPFLVGLTSTQRRELVKIGRKSQTFVVQALDMAEEHSDLMPRCLSVEDARRDMELFEALNPILLSLSQLQKLVEDTQMVAGSEAYAAARLAYQSAKTLGKGLGLDEAIATLL
ncbi:MAG: hypothetical protein AAFW75_31385 [Cyanobacteria bacterium J06636_16]